MDWVLGKPGIVYAGVVAAIEGILSDSDWDCDYILWL